MNRPPHGSRSERSNARSGGRQAWIAFALFGLLTGLPVLATLPGSDFEGDDGNMVSDGLVDWANVAPSSLRTGYDTPSGQDDDSLSGKEDEDPPGVTFGSIPSNKSDLLRFYAFHQRVNAGTEQDLMHIAWVRANTLGSANMDFEFNQSAELSSNGYTPKRTAGDFLITFVFGSGGNQIELAISRWTETGPCEATNKTPCWSPLEPLSGFAEAAVNTAEIVDPLEGGTLDALTFGEAVIDLTEADVFDREACTTFGTAHVKSRSSSSFSSSMKDFIRPIDISISNCASITIVKDAIPNSDETFGFDAPGFEPALFSLVDDGADDEARRQVITTRVDGTYSVRELPTEGWDLTEVACSAGGTAMLDPEGRLTGEISLDAVIGEAIECTFTNARRGRILVDQETIPAGDPQTFDFFLTGGPAPDSVNQAFVMTDGSDLFASAELRAGSYSLTQLDPGLAWDLTSMSCDDGSSPASISLDPGETVTCRFVNTKRGSIVVDNVTTPSGDPQAFDFTLVGGPSETNQTFALTDEATPYSSGLLLPGGGHSIGSFLPEGWLLESSGCNNGNAVTDVTVGPGETVVCSFNHIKMGRIVIEKASLPAGDPAAFDFSLSGGPGAVQDDFQLSDTGQHDSGFLVPGNGYLVSESAGGIDWDLTGIACTSNGSSTISGEGANADPGFQPGDDVARIDLGIADIVHCTFTNTKRGTIVVIKDSIPDDPQDFAFTTTGPETADERSLDDDGDSTDDPGQGHLPRSFTLESQLPGNYTITESDPGLAWDPTALECVDSSGSRVGTIDLEDRTAGITLPPGERITCVFTDTKRGTIVVEKFVVIHPLAPWFDATIFSFDFNSSFAGSFALRHGDTVESDLLRAGERHSVSESVPSGWQASTTCIYPDGSVDNGGTSRITVPAGATVHCTFFNEMLLHPGSSGFWRNWSNHYGDSTFLELIAVAFDDSPIYTDLFDTSGAVSSDALALIDRIYDNTSGGSEQTVLKELTSTMFNLAVSKEMPELLRNDSICHDCVVDFTDYPGAETLIRELGSNMIIDPITVGDVIGMIEGEWTGSLAGDWSFDALLESDKALLADLFEGFNQGNALIPDPTTYPDNPGCLVRPGLPDATSYMPYSAFIEVSGGAPPYTWELGRDPLPTGLLLNRFTGEIFGTPTDVGLISQEFRFKVVVRDGDRWRLLETSIVVHPLPLITTLAIPDAIAGVPYQQPLSVNGGTQPVSWSVTGGEVPDGLALDGATGLLSGTCTATEPVTENFLFTVEVIDMNGGSDLQSYTMSVMPSANQSCDTSLPAPGSPDLQLGRYGVEAMLVWTAVANASGYDAIQGSLDALHGSAGDFGASVESCVVNDTNSSMAIHGPNPARGSAFWYLVRGTNCATDGVFDAAGSGTQLELRGISLADLEVCP